MNNKTANTLYIFLILAVIITLIFIVIFLQNEGGECVGNPVVYFTEKNENIYCNCYDQNGMFIEGINEEVFRFDLTP